MFLQMEVYISTSGSIHDSVKRNLVLDMIREQSAAFVCPSAIDNRISLPSFVTCNSLKTADLAEIKGERFVSTISFLPKD